MTNVFQSITDEEMKKACATIDKTLVGAPVAYRDGLKSQLAKRDGIMSLPVSRPARDDRPTTVTLGLDPWLETVTVFLPVDVALAELVSETGGPAVLAKRALTLLEEERVFQLSREVRAQAEAEVERKATEATAARNAAWAKLTPAERMTATMARAHEIPGAAPLHWKP